MPKPSSPKITAFLHEYALAKGVFLKCCFVNADHAHALVDLPTSLSIEEMMHLFKGASSHFINAKGLGRGKFAWGRGYGVFSVSHSAMPTVTRYIATQEEHHRKRSYAEELKLLVERYGLLWMSEETVENGSARSRTHETHPVETGC